jgi:ribonuclease Z
VKSANIEIFSKGLYSSWCYHIPSRTLFDCGEGFATYQGNFMYGVERILISHGHGDHVLGLPSLIGCRNSARGDREKPLEIYYPHNNHSIRQLQKFIEERQGNKLRYDVKWIPIMPGFCIPLNNKQEIQSFPMEHQRNGDTIGYRIVEKRSKLKQEFMGKNIPELLKSGIKKENLSEEYVANLFAYCLDAYKIDPYWLKDCEVGVMDCTFLKKEDRNDNTHYSLDEAMKIFYEANGKEMIAAHISPRYHHKEIFDYSNICKFEGIILRYDQPYKI